MKEAALSAAALMGLMGFAAYYNNSGESSRARRAAYETEEYEEPSQALMLNETYLDVDTQPKEAELIRLLMELEWTGDDDLDADDVTPYQAKMPKVNFKKITRNKFGDKNWNAAFKKAHSNRFAALKDWLSFNDFRVSTPAATYDDPDAVDYNGYDKTHPHVQSLLDVPQTASYLSRRNFFQTGQNTVFIVMPTEVPLSSEVNRNVLDFGEYWQFIFHLKTLLDKYAGRLTSRDTPRIMLGRQSSRKIAWLSGQPQKYNRKRYPWTRVRSSTIKPSLQALQPFESQHIRELGQRIDADGESSPSEDRDCWVFKFHQELPQDSNQFLLVDTQLNAAEVRSKCTFIDIFVGYPAYDESVMKLWTAYDPSLQAVAPMDNDFSGFFIVPNHAELRTDEFREAVYKYMALAKSRSLCRCSETAYEPAVTQAPATAGAEFTQVPFGEATTVAPADVTAAPLDATDVPEVDDRILTEAPTAAAADVTEAPTVAGVLEASAVPVKEEVINSCCGLGLNGKPYDDDLATCCQDGSVLNWNEDGTDPCSFL